MTDVHLHLLLNHLPILGSLFALVLGIYGAARRQPAVVRAAFLALIVTGVGSFAATRTGEGAEDAVEELPGVSEALIHEHEEAAELANYAAIALALLALGVLVWRRRDAEIGTAPTAAILLSALVVFGLMARTGNLGGQIRHTEIRTATAASDTEPALAPSRVEHDDD